MSRFNMDVALSELTRVAAADRPQLAEDQFVRFILPILVNINNEQNLDLSFWLDIAGNPHRPIDVVDAAKKVLFTVPPILSRIPSYAPPLERKPGTISVSEIAYNYGAKMRAEHPGAADAYLAHMLRNEVIKPEERMILEYLKSWVTIYTRYKLPLSRLLGEEIAQQIEKKPVEDRTAKDDVSGEFDDL